MVAKPLFPGLIFDENDLPVPVVYVGTEPCYVVDDDGFRRHIPSEEVDRQILGLMKEQVKGNEDVISDQTAKMLGQEDIFSRAILNNQLKQIDQQLETLLQTGIPADALSYLGMMGFKITINVHGEVVHIHQPGIEGGEEF